MKCIADSTWRIRINNNNFNWCAVNVSFVLIAGHFVELYLFLLFITFYRMDYSPLMSLWHFYCPNASLIQYRRILQLKWLCLRLNWPVHRPPQPDHVHKHTHTHKQWSMCIQSADGAARDSVCRMACLWKMECKRKQNHEKRATDRQTNTSLLAARCWCGSVFSADGGLIKQFSSYNYIHFYRKSIIHFNLLMARASCYTQIINAPVIKSHSFSGSHQSHTHTHTNTHYL